MRIPLDEISTDDLLVMLQDGAFGAYSTMALASERARSENIIVQNATTGADLGYWHARSGVLEDMIAHRTEER